MLQSTLRLGSHCYELNASTFKKAALGFTAAAAILGTSAFATFPANAQQAVNVNNTPSNCAVIAEPAKRSICESFKRIDAANARAAAADRRGAEAERTSSAAKASVGCMDEVGKDILAAKAKGPLSPDTKATFKARLEKCDRVSSL